MIKARNLLIMSTKICAYGREFKGNVSKDGNKIPQAQKKCLNKWSKSFPMLASILCYMWSQDFYIVKTILVW